MSQSSLGAGQETRAPDPLAGLFAFYHEVSAPWAVLPTAQSRTSGQSIHESQTVRGAAEDQRPHGSPHPGCPPASQLQKLKMSRGLDRPMPMLPLGAVPDHRESPQDETGPVPDCPQTLGVGSDGSEEDHSSYCWSVHSESDGIR